MTKKVLLLLVIASTLGACQPTNNSNSGSATPSPSSGGMAISLNQTFPNSRYVAPAPPGIKAKCPAGSFDLTSQTLSPPSPGVTGLLKINGVGPTTELADGEFKITLTIPDGTMYSAMLQPLDPICGNVGPARPVSANLGLSYRAVVEEPSPNQTFACVFRSRADYSSFAINVTGTPLDSALQAILTGRIQMELLKVLDFAVASNLNQQKTGNPIPAGTDPRCNWNELPVDGRIVR